VINNVSFKHHALIRISGIMCKANQNQNKTFAYPHCITLKCIMSYSAT